MIGCRRRGGEVFIQVCDTGCGIACEQRPHIFKEFYRIPSQDNITIGLGLGLGLAIVEKLCTLLNHRVLMNSRPSKGSCFSIAAPATPQTKTPKNDSWILIVDDEISVRDAMRTLLTEWGYHVLVANSNHDAMQLVFAQQKTPDLIICDFHLHDGKHGLQLISDMSAYFSKKIPAFLISGCNDPSTQTAVYQAGFTLLGKPLKPMALRAIIQQTLHC